VALGPEIKRLRGREELLLEAARGFVACLKELALDVDEIGAETLKRNLDTVGDALQAEPTSPRASSATWASATPSSARSSTC
jgi:hypothetical protein